MPTRYSIKSGLLGVALAGVTVALISGLPDLSSRIVLALILAAASGSYHWYALIRKEGAFITIELIFLGLFSFLAVLGCFMSPIYLALGFFLHGFWDLVHHPRYLRSPGPAWYQPMCLAFDWVVAVFIALKLSATS